MRARGLHPYRSGGTAVHALTTVEAEKEFLNQVPSKLLLLYMRMEPALARMLVQAELAPELGNRA